MTLGTNGTFNITVPEGHYVEMTITFSPNRGFEGCYDGKYFEIRDGLNQSATLLAAFCEFYQDKTYVFRSSGRHMWMRLHRADYFPEYYKYHANYTAKSMNVTGMYSVTLDHFVCVQIWKKKEFSQTWQYETRFIIATTDEFVFSIYFL